MNTPFKGQMRQNVRKFLRGCQGKFQHSFLSFPHNLKNHNLQGNGFGNANHVVYSARQLSENYLEVPIPSALFTSQGSICIAGIHLESSGSLSPSTLKN